MYCGVYLQYSELSSQGHRMDPLIHVMPNRQTYSYIGLQLAIISIMDSSDKYFFYQSIVRFIMSENSEKCLL